MDETSNQPNVHDTVLFHQAWWCSIQSAVTYTEAHDEEHCNTQQSHKGALYDISVKQEQPETETQKLTFHWMKSEHQNGQK